MKSFLLVLTILLIGAFSGQAEAEDKYFCPCKKMFQIEKAKIAFMGVLQRIDDMPLDCPGFECKKQALVFRIEEPWRGVPVKGEVTVFTNDTSCGYGEHLMPKDGHSKIGQSFAVFTNRQSMSLCNSVIMHSSLLRRNSKKFIYFESDEKD